MNINEAIKFLSEERGFKILNCKEYLIQDEDIKEFMNEQELINYAIEQKQDLEANK